MFYKSFHFYQLSQGVFSQAKVAVRNASADVLLEEKEALEGQVANLLNRHEQLSWDLPMHMQHVRFIPSCVSCLPARIILCGKTRVSPLCTLFSRISVHATV